MSNQGQPQYGPPGGYPVPPPSNSSEKPAASTWWSLLAIAGTAAAVSIPEDDNNAWQLIGAWPAFAIACSLATLAPALRTNLNMGTDRAWRVAAGGLGGLALFWILFILPSIGQNVSLVATLSLAAGAMAVWTAPGRPNDGQSSSSSKGEWW